ncbi:MAG: hypothetical protein MUC87_08945 [Bacteroidia bacterium]|jgi:hypothetical protein|nr:hypothetical protein [Bacteroidia bacterium]
MEGVIHAFNCEEGYFQLEQKIAQAKSIRNTRFYPKAVNRTLNDAIKQWDAHLANCIINTHLEVYDVGSNFGKKSMSKMIEKLEEKEGGLNRYHSRIYDDENFNALNFIIIDYFGTPSELWIGWHIDNDRRLEEGRCYQTSEPMLIELFRRWHMRLFADKSANELSR